MRYGEEVVIKNPIGYKTSTKRSINRAFRAFKIYENRNGGDSGSFYNSLQQTHKSLDIN